MICVAPRWPSLETLEAYGALSDFDRLSLARAVAAALGPGFAPSTELLGSRRLAAVHHEHGGTARQRTTFAAIPGGAFDMGIRPEERDELVALIADDEERLEGEVDGLLARSLPVHRVSVRPFLLATEALLLEQARALSPAIAAIEVGRGRFSHLRELARLESSEVPAIIAGAPRGFRLASEAEWEWVAREGGLRSWIVDPWDWLAFKSSDGPNAFGVYILANGSEWLAGEWSRDHEEAPSAAVARAPAAEPGVSRGAHSGWQDTIEAVVTACAYREEGYPGADHHVRFARDLPSF